MCIPQVVKGIQRGELREGLGESWKNWKSGNHLYGQKRLLQNPLKKLPDHLISRGEKNY